MRAVTFDVSNPKSLLGQVLGRSTDAVVFGGTQRVAPERSEAAAAAGTALRRVTSALDCTRGWAGGLQSQGVVGYGRGVWNGESLHTFTLTQRLLMATGGSVAEMITHTYPLDRYRTALSAARNRRVSGAIKVVPTPRPEAFPR